MDWFLYDRELRHKRVKQLFEHRVAANESKYLARLDFPIHTHARMHTNTYTLLGKNAIA